MTHNPAAAHPRLMALLDGMEKMEQGATSGPWAILDWMQPDDSLEWSIGPEYPVRAICQVDEVGDPLAEIEYINPEGEPHPDEQLRCLSRNALPPLLADLRRRAEAAADEWTMYESLCGTARRMVNARKLNQQSREDAAETLDHAAQWRDYHATAHHACCTTALAAAAGTPALAVLAGELKGAME